MKEYVKSLTAFLQMVRRSGRISYGLRTATRYYRAAKVIIASGSLTEKEKEELRRLAKNSRAAFLFFNGLTSAELGRAANRQHPVKALVVSSLGDADLNKLIDVAQRFAGQENIEVILPTRRR